MSCRSILPTLLVLVASALTMGCAATSEDEDASDQSGALAGSPSDSQLEAHMTTMRFAIAAYAAAKPDDLRPSTLSSELRLALSRLGVNASGLSVFRLYAPGDPPYTLIERGDRLFFADHNDELIGRCRTAKGAPLSQCVVIAGSKTGPAVK